MFILLLLWHRVSQIQAKISFGHARCCCHGVVGKNWMKWTDPAMITWRIRMAQPHVTCHNRWTWQTMSIYDKHIVGMDRTFIKFACPVCSPSICFANTALRSMPWIWNISFAGKAQSSPIKFWLISPFGMLLLPQKNFYRTLRLSKKSIFSPSASSMKLCDHTPTWVWDTLYLFTI